MRTYHRDSEGLNPDLYDALYWFTADYHSGQWSRGYRLLCRVSRVFKPSPLASGPDGEEAQMIYDHLVGEYGTAV